ncbi:MAG: RDD family protein [Campylobacteraceae bacterium]|nr:RDD family protein [Campylobacteraceae bacterium]
MNRCRDKKHTKETKIIDKSIVSETFVSISSRFKSFLLDSFLLTTPIVYVVMYLIMGDGATFAENRGTGWLIILFFHMPLILILWKVKKQTPGLRAYDLILVDNKSGNNISFLQAFLRYLITTLSIISFFLLFVAFFRKDKKTIQDILTNTKIINQ